MGAIKEIVLIVGWSAATVKVAGDTWQSYQSQYAKFTDPGANVSVASLTGDVVKAGEQAITGAASGIRRDIGTGPQGAVTKTVESPGNTIGNAIGKIVTLGQVPNLGTTIDNWVQGLFP